MRLKIPILLFKNAQQFAMNNHPNEIVLLLRGKMENEDIIVENLLFPPMGVGGPDFASFSPNMLPIDFSIMGILHSHPSGKLLPSPRDLNNMYGRIMMIIGPPYFLNSVAAFKKNGERIQVEIE
jgi:proteasome lid subunit RPN8/RPN11